MKSREPLLHLLFLNCLQLKIINMPKQSIWRCTFWISVKAITGYCDGVEMYCFRWGGYRRFLLGIDICSENWKMIPWIVKWRSQERSLQIQGIALLPCGDEVRELLGAGSCEAFQSHGKEFGFYFECHGGPLEDLHLRVTQASVLKSLHRICAESRF